MKKTVTILGILLLLAGCAKKYEIARPEPLLPMETMEEILTESYLLEASLHIFETDTSVDLERYTRQQWQKIMQQHRVTTEDWKRNYMYYISKEPLRDTLMKHVGNRLTELEATEEVNYKTHMDSIMRQKQLAGELPFNQLPMIPAKETEK